jgi:hypothetical protein
MPVDLGAGRYLVLAADDDTPDPVRGYVGRTIPIPDGLDLPVGLDRLTWNGVDYWGFARQNSTTGETEWVLAAPPEANPNLAALLTLPGPGGWTVPASRTVILGVGRRLLELGLSGAELRPIMQDAYTAVVAERDAQLAQQEGPP